MWQIGMGTAAGAMMLANPVKAANAAGAAPYTGVVTPVLLIAAFCLAFAVSQRRRKAGVTC